MRGIRSILPMVVPAVLAMVWVFARAETQPAPIIVDYPLEASIFPPDFVPPTFLWRDPTAASEWRIEISFGSGADGLTLTVPGDRLKIGEIDQRTVSNTNKPPEFTPEQAAARAWKPAPELWETIKSRSVTHAATVTFIGLERGKPVSRGQVSITTSKDPVGAPIFYRDVPLMPSELKPGEIKPLHPKLMPYIAWRLRYVNEPRGKVLMEGIHTCANCHSFSRDGKTLGIDLDGPHNDKGLYALVPISRHMEIRDENVISWKKFRNQMEQNKRIGFMSHVSPDGSSVITATQVDYYVANFKDYRFLQVFYPTRGILAWYNRADGAMHSLPGADDPRYVHANAVWSPDGKELIFVRAEAKDSYPPGKPIAEYSNDPNEIQIQYDLYRIPFNNGKGGRPEPIAGASRNGMSNSFPKVSPDGKWIVYVQARNGQLMRPDGKLYIIPSAGGTARLMNCNTPLMNSWHSFSPNGRWMVFSSKSRSPYTQMFLTHIDENGNDSPAILIEDSTAANRAVNIPEFVNVPPGGLEKIDAPAAEFYRLYDLAYELSEKGEIDKAAAEWTKALKLSPDDAAAHSNYGALLLKQGRLDEAAGHFRKALELKPELANARSNLGLVLMQRGQLVQAVEQWKLGLDAQPDLIDLHVNLALASIMQRRYRDAEQHFRNALKYEPNRLPVLSNLAWLLATCPDPAVRNAAQAVELSEKALKLSGGNDARLLDILGAAYAEAGRFPEAVDAARRAAALAAEHNDRPLATDLSSRVALYQSHKAYREQP